MIKSLSGALFFLMASSLFCKSITVQSSHPAPIAVPETMQQNLQLLLTIPEDVKGKTVILDLYNNQGNTISIELIRNGAPNIILSDANVLAEKFKAPSSYKFLQFKVAIFGKEIHVHQKLRSSWRKLAKNLSLKTAPPITGYCLRLPENKTTASYHYNATITAAQAHLEEELAAGLSAIEELQEKKNAVIKVIQETINLSTLSTYTPAHIDALLNRTEFIEKLARVREKSGAVQAYNKEASALASAITTQQAFLVEHQETITEFYAFMDKVNKQETLLSEGTIDFEIASVAAIAAALTAAGLTKHAEQALAAHAYLAQKRDELKTNTNSDLETAKKLFLKELDDIYNNQMQKRISEGREEHALNDKSERQSYRTQLDNIDKNAYKKIEAECRLLSMRYANSSPSEGGIPSPPPIEKTHLKKSLPITRSFFKSSFYTQGAFTISIKYTDRVINKLGKYFIQVDDKEAYIKKENKILAHHSIESPSLFDHAPLFYHLEFYHDRIHLMRYFDSKYHTIIMHIDRSFDSEDTHLLNSASGLTVSSAQPVYNLELHGLARETYHTSLKDRPFIAQINKEILARLATIQEKQNWHHSLITQTHNRINSLDNEKKLIKEKQADTLRIKNEHIAQALSTLALIYSSDTSEEAKEQHQAKLTTLNTICLELEKNQGILDANITLICELISHYKSKEAEFKGVLDALELCLECFMATDDK